MSGEEFKLIFVICHIIVVDSDMSEMDVKMEEDFHAIIHTLMGGIFDCSVTPNDLMDQYPSSVDFLATATSHAYDLWMGTYSGKSYHLINQPSY